MFRFIIISGLMVLISLPAFSENALDRAIKEVGPSKICVQFFEANIEINRRCTDEAAKTATPQLRKACIALFDRSAALKQPCEVDQMRVNKEIRKIMEANGEGNPAPAAGARTGAGAGAGKIANGCVQLIKNNTNRVSVKNTCGTRIFVSYSGETGCTNWCGDPILPGMSVPTPIKATEEVKVKACYEAQAPVDKSDGTFYCSDRMIWGK